MPSTDDTQPFAPAPLSDRGAWEACDHCQAPLDEQQRYCVACGTRRAGADDPAARWLASATRRSGASAGAPGESAARPAPGWVMAVLVALLPLVAGVGVLVGRGGSNGDARILEALRAQKAPIVNVVAGGGGGAAAVDGRPAAARRTAAAKAKAASGGRQAKILARGPAGAAHQLTGATPTAKQRAESAKAIETINHAKGKAYVDSQRNLPDSIVIP